MSPKDGVTVERQSPEDTFELLSNSLRVRILQALSEADNPLPFSRLRGAVEERDSGKFNYHLKKLVGHLVVHDDDGYRLSLAGRKMYGTIISGAYTTEAKLEPFEFDGSCPMCGSPHLIAEYANEHAKMYCDDCDMWSNEFSFPPASLEHFTREELPYAFDRWMRATLSKAVYGFCSTCGGRVDGTLALTDNPENSVPVQARYMCDRCGDTVKSYPSLPVIYQVEAIEYFADHGIDVVNDPSWQYVSGGTDISIELASDDPMRARVRFALGDETLVAIVNSNVKIESITFE